MKLNIENKLETTVNALSSMSIIKHFPIDSIFVLPCLENETKIPLSLKKFKKNTSPVIFYEAYHYYWIAFEFEVHEIKNNQNVFLCFDTLMNGGNGNRRPQGLLYLNNELIQGIDINHTDVLITEKGHYEARVFYYTHEVDVSFPLFISLKYKDVRTVSLYYDYQVILESLKMLLKDDPKYKKTIAIVDNAMNLIDFRNPCSKQFYDSIKASKQYLYKYFYNKECGKQNNIINCVGHSHIDVAWLWDLNQTRQKVQRTFSTALKLMDEYKQYNYMHTTPQVFEFLKQDNPSLYKRVKSKILNQRFEIDGAMWVEADCNLTSGESLVRQILYGTQFIKQEFNVDCTCVFEPDVFGYNAQLPQIIKKSNINRFVTAKIGWNDTNRFPYDTFIWRGIDDSDLFTYLISTCDANPRIGVKDTTYTNYVGDICASHILGNWNRYQNKNINNVTLLTYGWGDGGGGPTREMIEKLNRYSYGLPGLGKTKISTLKETLNCIETNFYKNTDEKNRPIWKGELYLEFHRGTYTSVPRIKKNNRLAESLLYETELYESMNSILFNNKYNYAGIKSNYKTLLLNQFHDIIPGSSIEKVYLDSDKQFESIFKFTSSSINNSISSLLKHINSNDKFVILNPNSFSSDDIVSYKNKIYVIKDVPSLGYKTISNLVCNNNVKVYKQTIENQFYIIKFNLDGSISSLFSKVNKFDYVKKNKPINKFVCYEDMPFEYDNWELTPYHFEKCYPIDAKATFKIIDKGDAKGFEITHKYFNSSISQTILLYDGLERIDFITNINWKEKRQVLKVLFPFNFIFKNAQYDIQFGNISRPVIKKNSWDEAKFEVVGQKWCDVSGEKYGVGLINNGKYGHAVNDNVLSLTLIKSGSFPYDGASDIVPTFTYSLLPHKLDFTNSNVIQEGYKLNRPLILEKIINKPNKEAKPDNIFSLLSINKNNVFIESIKLSEDQKGYIIRLYEGFGKSSDVKLRFNFNFKKCYLCNLMESNIKEVEIENHTINIKIKKYEIVTLRIVK